MMTTPEAGQVAKLYEQIAEQYKAGTERRLKAGAEQLAEHQRDQQPDGRTCNQCKPENELEGQGLAYVRSGNNRKPIERLPPEVQMGDLAAGW